ncbi:MAG: MFS transporter [Rhodospirillaceae bacterium]|nr:MFS transporter [Rhodospirillaceae bacterium]MBT7266069.1 MFS transporter [Rhodospirillaceae bacterium]
MSIATKIRAQFLDKGIARALRHREYRIFALTNWVSTMGNWFQRVGIGWLAWDITHSGFWLGAVALAEALPLLLFIAFAGAIIDRIDRMRLIRYLQMLIILLGVLLVTLTALDLMNIVLLVLITTAHGMIQTFHLPVRLTIVPNLVPRSDLTPAVALNSALFNTARFIGPAIAGFVIAKFSVSIAFALSIIGFVAFAIGLLMINPRSEQRQKSQPSGLLADVWEGIRYVGKHSSIGPVLLFVFIGASFSRAFMDLAPGIADDVFNRGAEGFGLLLSAIGVGGICGAIGLANYGKTDGLMNVSLVSLALTALFLLAFTATNIFWLALIFCACLGVSLGVSTNAPQILIQNTVDGAMRGRVMSIFGLTYRAGPALGALIMGAASTYVGLQIPVAGGAVICLIAVLLMLPKRKRLAAEMEGEKPAPEEAKTA